MINYIIKHSTNLCGLHITECIWHSTYKMHLKRLRGSESLNTTSYYYIFEVIIKVVLLGLKPQSKVGYRCPNISVSGEKAHDLSSLHLLKSADLEANIKKIRHREFRDREKFKRIFRKLDLTCRWM